MISAIKKPYRAVLQNLISAAALCLLLPSLALASSGGVDANDVAPPAPPAVPEQPDAGVIAPGSGGAVPGGVAVKPSAKIVNDRIVLPVGAPQYAVNVANAASTIAAEKPGYSLGGGHKPEQLEDFLKFGKVNSVYDCSGYAGTTLAAGNLHTQVLPSGDYMGWGKAFKKTDRSSAWVHVYAHSGHMMVQVGGMNDGVFIDTSNSVYGLSGKGPIITERKRSIRGFSHRVPSQRVLARAARIASKG